jgi:hypothetical protein
MTEATIIPLRSGGAIFELNSMTHWFPDWRTAVEEAEAREMPWVLARLPEPAPDALPLMPS